MNDHVLVKFYASEHYINIRTITHQRKSPLSFDLAREQFTELEATGNVLIQDGHSFAHFRLIDAGATVQIDFTWLSAYSDETVKGYTQTVKLDYDCLAGWIWDSLEENGPTRWTMYYSDHTCRRAKLDFSSPGAQETIRRILAVPVLRHKFSRAVRDNFQWPNDGDCVVRFFADYDRYSFFFQEQRGGEDRICGGLILHHHDGLATAKYSVHT